MTHDEKNRHLFYGCVATPLLAGIGLCLLVLGIAVIGGCVSDTGCMGVFQP